MISAKQLPGKIHILVCEDYSRKHSLVVARRESSLTAVVAEAVKEYAITPSRYWVGHIVDVPESYRQPLLAYKEKSDNFIITARLLAGIEELGSPTQSSRACGCGGHSLGAPGPITCKYCSDTGVVLKFTTWDKVWKQNKPEPSNFSMV